MMYPDCGRWESRPAPEFNADMSYRHPGGNREIRVYDSVDARYVHEDFFSRHRDQLPLTASLTICRYRL